MALAGVARGVRFGGFEIDFSQQELRKRGLRIRLQHKPFQILELLLRRPGALVTREEIARHLWPDAHVDFERGLNTAINTLRQALRDSLHGSRFIETRAGLGYCFIAPVEELTDERISTNVKNVHHDCLKGRYFLDKMTEDDARKALGFFESALVDEGCAAVAYAGLTDAWCQFAELLMLPAAASAEKAKEFAILALSSDSKTAAAHVAMGRVHMLFDWDWKRARAEFVRALELDPRHAPAHRFYTSLLSITKEPAKALESIQTALSLEPLSLPTGVDYARILYANRDFEAAAEQCWRVLALEHHFWPAQLVLGLAYRELNMPDEATAELQNAVTCSGSNSLALATLGNLEELQKQARHRYVNPLSYAVVHANAGEMPEARDWLTRASTERDPCLLWLSHTPVLEGITRPL